MRVALFASGRADLWPMVPVLGELLAAGADVELLLPENVEAGPDALGLAGAGLRWTRLTAFDAAEDGAVALIVAMGVLANEVAEALTRSTPDLLVVLGDRFELLGVCAAATLQRIPLVHLYGGEITEGAIDDAIRHAVTKLSHLHLAATEDYGRRIRSLGEEPWRVIVTGGPAIDRLHAAADASSAEELARFVGVPLVGPVALLTYHAPTMAPELLDAELEAVLAAAAACRTVIATHPGPDRGSARILERLLRWQRERDGVAVVPSLGRLYPRALAEADVVLGNSSSGVVEAPTFGVPVVNVGDRQLGRVRWAGIIDVPGVTTAVVDAVARALEPAFRTKVAREPNPYGDGHAAPRVARAILEAPLDRLLHKRFCDPKATNP